jgi:hypothetical protein
MLAAASGKSKKLRLDFAASLRQIPLIFIVS